MGIQLGSNFTVNTNLPLDDRAVVADLTARDAIASGKRFEGMIVYVVSEATNFQLIGGILNADWAELSGSGGASASSGSLALTNNSVNDITAIGEYLTGFSAIIIDYYIYRRSDSANKRMSGRIMLESVNDAVSNPDKWTLTELIRSEFGGDSGVTFSLDDIDTGKSILVATLDDLTGTGITGKIFYSLTKLPVSGDSYVLPNNAATNLSLIGEYLSASKCVLVDYFAYRRTDTGYRTLSGKIFLEGVSDGATNPDKWSLFESERSENFGASGITFSLDDIDTEKSILVATLDDMTGASHSCVFYYKKTVLPI